MPQRRGRLLLAARLAQLLVPLLLALQAAAQSCSITVPAASQNFDLRFVSGPVVRTLTVRRVPVTQRTYCFDIARNAKRGPGAGAVCDDTASPCCNAALIKPGKIYLRTSNNCSADRRTAGAFRAIAWTLNNATLRSVRQVAVKNARGAFEFEVTLPATVAWSAQGTAQLCLTTSDRTGTAVNPCPTLQTMCPDAGGCPVWFASQPFVQPSNRKRVTCCTTPASRQLAYECTNATGVDPSGYSNCHPCSAGSVTGADPDGGQLPRCTQCTPATFSPFDGGTVCQHCATGTVSDSKFTSCIAPCNPGFGGDNCTVCDFGTYSPGANVSTGVGVTCAACPRGLTTDSPGAASVQECDVPANTCTPGTGGVSCAPCARGYFSPGGTADDPVPDCQPCTNGFSTPTTGANSSSQCIFPICTTGRGDLACALCARGYWSTGGSLSAPQRVCKQCPPGLTTSGTGSGSVADCIIPVCNAGEGGPECDECPAGYFNPAPGTLASPTTACGRCPATQTSSIDHSSCVKAGDCSPGAGGATCTPCQRGYWSPGGAPSSGLVCTMCDNGNSTRWVAATSRAACNVPICKPGYGGLSCDVCTYSFYSPGGTLADPVRACRPCPPGAVTFAKGATSAADCVTSNTTCPEGYALIDASCTPCGTGAWSIGGYATTCKLCPDGQTTRDVASPGPGSCNYLSQFADPNADNVAFTWSQRATPDGRYPVDCRTALYKLFTAKSWTDDAVDDVRDICQPRAMDIAQMNYYWASNVLRPVAVDVFGYGRDGTIELGWSAAGVDRGRDLIGTCDTSVALDPEYAVNTLQDFYDSGTYDFSLSCSYGDIYESVAAGVAKASSPAAQQALVDGFTSLVDQAIAAMEERAIEATGGNLDSAEARVWVLTYKLSADVRALGPLSAANSGANLTGMMLAARAARPTFDSPLLNGTGGMRKLLQLLPQGFIEVPVTDAVGRPRTSVACGAGIRVDGEVAQTAVVYGAATEDCENWLPLADTDQETEVKSLKYTNDEELTQSVFFSLEVKVKLLFFTITAGMRWQLDTYRTSKSVYVTQLATKLAAAPVALPPRAPLMTPAARAYLARNGVAAFYDKYGSHFVVGFRQGGSMTFTYEMQSNQVVSSQSMGGKVGSSQPFKGVESVRSSTAGPVVNIKKSFLSNAPVNVPACQYLADGTLFSYQAVTACVEEWLKTSGYKKYSAWAVPYALLPEFQQLAAGSGAKALSESGLRRRARALLQSVPPVPVADYKFKDTGMLMMRTQAIANALSGYRFRRDGFYTAAAARISAARANVTGMQTWLRANSQAGVDAWRARYLVALGLVNAASNGVKFVPKGARCGWCVNVEDADVSGGCTSTCTSTLDCMLSCPGQPDAQCATKGFVYSFVAGSPVCKTAVSAPVCTKFGTEESGAPGAYFCHKLTCDWTDEYCDGDLDRDEDGVWTCLGQCRARVLPENTGQGGECTCTPDAGAPQPDAADADYCYYGQRADAAMWAPTAAEAISPGVWRRLSTFTDAFGPFSLWAGGDATGYGSLTAAFLQTNCPALAPISIVWPPTAGSPSAVRSAYPNSCGCRRSDGTWAQQPAAPGAGSGFRRR